MQNFKKKGKSCGYETRTRSIISKRRWRWHLNFNITAVNLFFIVAFTIPMQFSEAETKQPILIDSAFSQPTRLQLRFRPMGKYAASTFTSHIRIPFNYSSLIGLQEKFNSRLDNFFNILEQWNFMALPELDVATLKSIFQLYKGNTNKIFKLFQDLLTSLPLIQERQCR
jgi:hypothetical protein